MLFKDQMHRTIRLESTPKRIVSLVPSQTEFLASLGLEDEVVGITKFCIHPKRWFRSKTRVGGTKNVNLDKVKSLQPDLIVANKEENTQEDIEALMEIAPVWISDIYTLDDAFQMMLSLGEICGKSEVAIELVDQIRNQFQQFERQLRSQNQGKVVYLIWKNPYIAVGSSTFIDHLLSRCGFQNLLFDQPRYPEWIPSSDQALDFIFLSSEPFPFKTSDIEELKAIFPAAQIQLVDGELFSWYGSRLLESVPYFEELIRSIRTKRK